MNFVSCVNDIEKNYDQQNIIAFDTFKEILKETWLLDAHKTNNQNYSLFPYDSLNEISLSILKKHNTSPLQFSSTIIHYSQNPNLADSLLNCIKIEFEKTYSSLPNKENSVKEELNNIELMVILKQCPFYIYRPNETTIHMNNELRDSLFIYFRRNPEKLGHASLRSFSNKLNKLIKENKSK